MTTRSVLLAHTFYRSSAPSGEDVVFRNERDILEAHGIKVIPFVRYNDDIDDSGITKRVHVALSTTWSRDSFKALSRTIRREQPHVAHFHNTFPQISPSGYAACKRCGIPVIQTLHNFRLICPGASLQRNGRPCEDCVGTNLLPALRHRCYRGSLAATGAVTLMLTLNRFGGSYHHNVDRYIALTEFAASRLRAGGLPADKILVKPNSLPNPPCAGKGEGGYAVYVGRLSVEKGVLTMLNAWRRLSPLPLKILGDGPLYGELRAVIEAEKLPVELLGHRPRSEVLDIVGRAVVQIVPSECYEGFPMVILEAYACGTPVVASRIGSLEEIVEDNVTGTRFSAGDVDNLTEAVLRITRDCEKLSQIRKSVRQTFDRLYNPERNFEQLVAIYDSVLGGRSFS